MGLQQARERDQRGVCFGCICCLPCAALAHICRCVCSVRVRVRVRARASISITHLPARVRAGAHAHTHARTHTHKHTHTHEYFHYAFACPRTCGRARTHTRTHTHTYTHVRGALIALDSVEVYAEERRFAVFFFFAIGYIYFFFAQVHDFLRESIDCVFFFMRVCILFYEGLHLFFYVSVSVSVSVSQVSVDFFFLGLCLAQSGSCS